MTALRDRSMNGELLDGMVDGTYKRIVPDHSNYKDPNYRVEREDRLNLNAGVNGYGLFEATEKRTPDGRFVRDYDKGRDVGDRV